MTKKSPKTIMTGLRYSSLTIEMKTYPVARPTTPGIQPTRNRQGNESKKDMLRSANKKLIAIANQTEPTLIRITAKARVLLSGDEKYLFNR